MASRASSDVVVRFIGDTGNLARGMDGLQGRFTGVATSLKGIASAGAVVGAISFFKGAIDEATEAERVTRKTEAVLKSTGGQARVTAGHIGGLSEKMSEMAGVDDEVIQQGNNVLLTFTKIRNEVGAGNDIFDQASRVSLDMAAALDKTGDSGAAMQENAIRIGKALNDPIKGMTALTKVGVSFTQAQREQVKALVESGDTLGAQKIILAELNTEFGGMAAANATASGKAAVAWENFAEAVGERVMPAVNAVGEWLVHTGVPKLDALADTVGDAVVPAFRMLASAGRGVVEFWQDLPGPIQTGAIAMGAWMLLGDRVEGMFGRMRGSTRGFGDDVRTAMGAFDVNRAQATFMVLEERLPIVGQMGQAFRDTSTVTVGWGQALGGLQGHLVTFSGVAQGIGSAAFTGLKAAAGGLLNVIGGPWGLAIGGAGALLAIFASRSSRAAQEQQGLKAQAAGVAKAIVEQTGATEKATRAKAAEALSNVKLGGSEYDLLKMSEDLGISTADLVSAYLGEEDALHRVKEVTSKYVNEDGSLKLNTEKGRTAWELANALHAVKSETEDGVESERRKKDATEGTTEATGKGVAAEQAATDATKERQEAVDALLDSLRKYWGESAAAVDSSIAWEQQWDSLAQSIVDNGTSLDITTEAGRNNAGALGDLIKTSQDMMTQDIAAQVPMGVATQKHVDRTNALIEEATRNGLNADAVAGLIGQYNGVPSDVTTWLSQKGFDAVKQNLTWLTAIQTLLKDGIEATPDAINNRMKRATGYTSGGNEDYAGGRAVGGLITGPGTGTSDTAGLFRLSNKEFVERAAAVDYYGVPFMSALNNLRIPREALPGLAGGGLAAPYPVDMSKTMLPSFDQVKTAFLSTHPELNKIGQMQTWARAQAGKKYLWGAVGPGTYDCSGLVGNLYAMARGLPQYRRYFTTAGMGPGKFGMAPGAGKFTVYLGPGHTAANVGGLHVEAYGGNGTPVAVGRVGTPLSYYNQTMHLTGLAKGGLAEMKTSASARMESFYTKGWPEPPTVGGYKNGGWLMPGQLAFNETRKPERVLNEDQWAKIGGDGAAVHVHFHGPVGSQQQMENWLTKSLDNLQRAGRLPKR